MFRIVLSLFFIILGISWITPFKNIDFKKINNIQMRVISFPRKGIRAFSYYVSIFRINNMPVRLRAKVIDYASSSVNYYDKFELRNIIKRYEYNHNVFYRIWIKRSSDIKRIPSTFWDTFIKGLTVKVNIILEQNLPQRVKTLISSAIFGRREFVDHKLKGVFINSGTAHILAISGLHIGVVAVIIMYLLKVFNLRFRIRIVITMLFIGIYALICGIRPSILRAVMMTYIFLWGYLLNRRVEVSNSLFLAGIICLLFNPLWLFDVGFQMSFFATLFIIYGFKLLSFSNKWDRFALFRYVKNTFFASFFANLGIMPLVSFYFGKVYILNILFNLIILPLFALLIILTFLFIILYSVPLMGVILANNLSFWGEYFIRILGYFSSLNMNFIRFSLNSYLYVVAYYVIFLLLYMFIKKGRIYS